MNKFFVILDYQFTGPYQSKIDIQRANFTVVENYFIFITYYFWTYWMKDEIKSFSTVCLDV